MGRAITEHLCLSRGLPLGVIFCYKIFTIFTTFRYLHVFTRQTRKKEQDGCCRRLSVAQEFSLNHWIYRCAIWWFLSTGSKYTQSPSPILASIAWSVLQWTRGERVVVVAVLHFHFMTACYYCIPQTPGKSRRFLIFPHSHRRQRKVLSFSIFTTGPSISSLLTTHPLTGAGCHRWRLLINCSLTTIVLRLSEIRYCSIVAKSSLEISAYHSLPKNQTRKIQKSWNKKYDN